MKENPFAPKGGPEGPASRAATSVGANISRMMDGEVDDAEFQRCIMELRSGEAMQAWMCYHVIGDSLRGAHGISAHRLCGQFSTRFRTALAAEPTVLAPRERVRTSQPATFAWAVAATVAAVTVVGWTAFSMVDVPPTAIAKAREAASVRAAQVKPPADVASEYLLAHQEFSPAMAIQGGAPYLRAATATAVEPQPKP